MWFYMFYERLFDDLLLVYAPGLAERLQKAKKGNYRNY